jgi:tRNA modification GTPase
VQNERIFEQKCEGTIDDAMSALKTDTIAAIATPPGRSALAVIRISGPDAFSVADFALAHPRPTAFYTTRTLHRASVLDNTDTVDDVLVAVFHAPNSFTGEDTVEISCHGGNIAVRLTLEILLRSGARLADPGEFTLRAYLNGKLDLAQAEAVIDTIDARTDTALRLANSQKRGDLSRAVEHIRERLVGILVRVEATIDFPEDVGEFPVGWYLDEAHSLERELSKLIDSAGHGILLREGISVVLAGAPNSGKSSLLNALLRTDRAIVTAIPGTTRDVIEESIEIAGIPVRLSDTAGLRETDDEVEQIGVERTHAALDSADIIIEVRDITLHDASQAGCIDIQSGTPRILVYNKCDLADTALNISDSDAVILSAKTGAGLDKLESAIIDIALGGSKIDQNSDIQVTHRRHKIALETARDALVRGIELVGRSEPIDLISIEISAALAAVGQITGASAPDEIVNEIFHRFCIGK